MTVNRSNQEPHEAIAERAAILAKWYGDAEPTEVFIPLTKQPIEGRVRLAIDFETPQDMVEWLESAKGSTLPSDVTIYAKDSIDESQVQGRQHFVVKRAGDRPDDFRVYVRRTHEDPI